MAVMSASILIHLDFLSIFENGFGISIINIASILIHLDFLSIYTIARPSLLTNQGFNPYSPGFSIYLVYLLDILIRSISSKLFDT